MQVPRLKGVQGLHVNAPKNVSGPDPLEVPGDAPYPVESVEQRAEPVFQTSDEPYPVETSPVESSYRSSASYPPDTAAKIQRFAAETGEPPEFVEANLPELEKASNEPHPSFFAKLDEQYPGTSAFLAQPKNMAVAHDDMENAAKHEEIINGARVAHTFMDEVLAGYQASSTGLILRGRLPDVVADPNGGMVAGLVEGASTMVSDLPAMVVGGAAGGIAGGAAGTLTVPVIGTVSGAGVGAAAGGFAYPAMIKKALTQRYQGGLGGFDFPRTVEDFEAAVGQSLNVLKEGVKQGTVGAIGHGSIGLAGKLGGGTVSKLGAELVSTTVAGAAVEGEAPTARDFVQGAILTAGMHVAMPLAGRAARLAGDSAGAAHELIISDMKAQQTARLVDSLSDAAKASKLRGRLPEAHEQLLAQLTKDGPIESVYIPVADAEAYFQSKKIDPAEAFDRLGAGESYAEAVATGGDVKVATATMASSNFGLEHFQGLRDDLKASAEDVTVKQSNERRAAIAKAVEEAQRTAEAEAAQKEQDRSTTETIDHAGRVFDNLKEQLIEAGLSDGEATTNSTLHRAFFGTLSERTGIPIESLVERYPVEVTRRNEVPESTGVLTAAQMQEARTLNLNSRWVAPETAPQGRAFPERVTITDVSPARLEGQSSVSAQGVKDFIARFRNKKIENDHTGWSVDVPRKGLEKAVRNANDRAHALAASHLDELFENAIHLTEEVDRKRRSDLKAVHKFYAPFRAEGKDYIARIQVNETTSGEKFYDQIVVEKEGPAIAAAKATGEAVQNLSGEPLGQPPVSTGALAAGEATPLREGPTLSIAEFKDEISLAKQAHEYFQNVNGPRGRIVINGTEFKIDLFKKADRSTFLHESGHMFLEVMKDISSANDAPAGLKADFQAIRDFVGAKEGEALTTAHHEKFAEAFEQYLSEGKAPSRPLVKAFRNFRKWLTSVYKQLNGAGFEISDDIRGVMDRMIATDAEIERASRLIGIEAAELPVLPEALRNRAEELQNRARDYAETILMKRQMAEMSADHKEFLKSKRAELTEDALSEVAEEPLFRAAAELSEIEGAKVDAYDLAERGLKGELSLAESVAMETAAELHGFADAESLARSLSEAKASDLETKMVNARVEEGMAPFADLRNTEAFREAALDAVHNQHTAELLALEREALGALVNDATVRLEVGKRKRLEASIDAAQAKVTAREILSKKSVKDAGNSRIYITAERNAAARAARFAEQGEFEKAAIAKQEQLLNHALATEAKKNSEQIAKSLKRMEPYADRGADMLGMNYGFLRHLDQLLARHGLSEARSESTETLAAIAKEMQAEGKDMADIANETGLVRNEFGQWMPESLPQMAQRVNENYYSLTIPDSVLLGAQKGFKDLTFQELRDLETTVRSIAGVGKKYNRFLGDFIKADLKASANEIGQTVEANVGKPYAEKFLIGEKDQSKFRKAVSLITELADKSVPDLVNVLTICEFLDRGHPNGPMKKYIYRPMAEAQNTKLRRTAETNAAVRSIFEKHFAEGEFDKYANTSEVIPEFGGRKLTKEQQLGLLLNWGNEGNRQRIRDGYGVSDAQVEEVINRLPKRDFEFAQEVWNHLDTYWPEIAKLEMDVNGVEPGRVQPARVRSVHGDFEGGYYPISYDPTKAVDALNFMEQKNELYKQFSPAKAHTESGHAKARATRVSMALDLTINPFFNHLENVNHDLAFRRAIIDTNRLLSQPAVKTALSNALDIQGPKALSNWLKAIASDQSDPMTRAAKVLRWTRFKTTVMTLGFRVATVPLDITGNLITGCKELGTANMAAAVRDYVFSRGEHPAKAFVEGKSEVMKQRATQRDRDIAEMARNLKTGEPGMIQKYAFWTQAWADEAVAIPLWMGKYKDGLSKGLSDREAVHFANEGITKSVGSGSKLDQVGIQRGGEFQKIFTMYYSFMSMQYNRYWLDAKNAGLEYREGHTMDAAAIVGKAALYMGMTALSENLWKELFRNNQKDDDKERLKRIAARTISQPFGMVPIVRDVAPKAIEKLLGNNQARISFTPLESAFENIVLTPAGVGAKLAQGKSLNQRDAEGLARTGAQLTGTPQTINTLAFNFIDWMNEKGEASWKDFLSRRTKK